MPKETTGLTAYYKDVQRIDPSVTVPYWDWTVRREIPPWLQGFPDGVRRNPQHPDGLPTRVDIWTRLRLKPYAPFTIALEGVGPGIPGGPGAVLPPQNLVAGALGSAHNRVHVWVGGDMGVIATAVKDPLFWLHHAQVDRLWHVWQTQNPGDHPLFVPFSDGVMTPWAETYADVADIRAAGYRYEDETFGLDLPVPVPVARKVR